MKRVLLSVTGTVLGLVGLLSFKSHGSPLGAAGALAGPAGAGSGSVAPQPPRTTHRSNSQSSGRGNAGNHHHAVHRSATPTSTTLLGRPIQTPYGVVQVRVTVAGSHITKVSYAQLTAFDGTSQQINSYAAPILVRQTMQAQSARIDGVSGASYTSAGYEQSLQSALDKAAGLR
ncbi:MAG TPA: FMN-binding protein [Jatrophihabitans sp.]|nr:FMN-binding protein [Jatrophihabitans sp.]